MKTLAPTKALTGQRRDVTSKYLVRPIHATSPHGKRTCLYLLMKYSPWMGGIACEVDQVFSYPIQIIGAESEMPHLVPWAILKQYQDRL